MQMIISRWLKRLFRKVYVKFKLASVKLDWSPNRRSSRGGYYADGPGINIAMSHLVRENKGEFIVCMNTSLLILIQILGESIQEINGTGLS